MSESIRLEMIPPPHAMRTEMEYHDSTYFTSQQQARLPTPAEVIALGHVRRGRAFVASLESRGLFVKYGPDVRVEEALSMRALRSLLGSKVPIPEIFGWRRDQKETFIYMQLMPGPNLEERWDTINENDKVAVTDQLHDIMKSLRSVKQCSQAPLIGMTTLSRVIIKLI